MPTNGNIPVGKPCWIDFVSSNLEKVKPFYSQLFGWNFANMGENFGNYNIISGEHGPVGGGMQHSPEFMGPNANKWDIYFAVDDAQKTLDAASAAGGQQTVPPMSIGDQGTMAFGVDENGASYGVWQQGTLRGFAAWGEHGYPAWFELHTRDADAAVKFYSSVLPVTVGENEMGEGMTYYTLDVEGDQAAGIWDINGVLPGDAPTEWSVYFFVDDPDAACAKVEQLGGTVVMGPESTEYGRMASLQDPAGATFNIIGDMPGS